jgi:multidrug efflux system outer membrane protein
MRRALICALALALAGCAMVGPDYRRPATDLPAAYGEPGTAASALPLSQQWWTLYGDATLDDLVRSGLARNADVRLATARVEEAEAVLREAHATLAFPLVELDADASRGRSLQLGTANSFSVGVSTSFEVDLWGRLRRAERSVRDQLLATRYASDTVALTLAATIARSYFAALSLDSQYAASGEILRAAEESVVLARKRADAGVASALDVYQAGALRTAAAAQAKEIARQRAVIVHQLGSLTGRLDIALPAKDLASLPIPPLPPAGLPSALLERRPDVRQAEASLSAATERIGVARAAQFPTLRLTGSLGSQSPELSSLLSTGSRVWSVGLGLAGPIIDGGRYAARTQQAEAQARQAEATYRKAVETAFREVSDALSNVRLAAEAEGDLQSRLSDARNALRLAQRRYEGGYSAYLEVLDAQRTLNDALLAFIRNRQAYLSYTVDLMNSLGGGWTPPGAASS